MNADQTFAQESGALGTAAGTWSVSGKHLKITVAKIGNQSPDAYFRDLGKRKPQQFPAKLIEELRAAATTEFIVGDDGNSMTSKNPLTGETITYARAPAAK